MSSKKKIILVGSIPPPHHGSNIYFSNLLNSDLRKEFEVRHLDTSDHRDLDNLTKLEFTNVYLALRNIAELVILLKKFKPDIVYIPPASHILPYLRDGLFIYAASLFSQAKIVLHYHGGKYFRNEFYDKSNIFAKSFVRNSLRRADHIIVLSNSLRSIFENLAGSISAVPNGTEFGMNFSPEMLERKDLGKIRISFLGNLFESKGVTDVLEAALCVTAKHGNVEFRFAGDWTGSGKGFEAKCREYVRANALGEYVKFTGKVLAEEKEKFLLETDIFVFPSRNEGSPLVLIEAMSAGCPVISTSGVGAIDDIVDDGVTGILINSKSPQQLCDAIVRLIESPEQRKSMGTNGRIKFEKYYTLEKNIEAVKRVFREV